MLTIDFFKFGLDHPVVNAWFRGMYQSFFMALEELGLNITYNNVEPNRRADILVVPVGGGQDKSSAQAMQAFEGPVILNVGAADYWWRRAFLYRWLDRILFVYGNDRSEFSKNAFADIGIPYYHFPFASNPDVMRPLGLPKLYDLLFVGNAGSGTGRHRYIELLLRSITIGHKVMLIGPGWERYGFPSQSIAWGELLNMIYNLSHICINISTDEQKQGAEKRLDANNRLFDLAMAGCFQISNAPQVVRYYFNESEVVAVDPPEEWVSTILYYLNHLSETEPYRLASRSHALANHTWKHRAEQFLSYVDLHLAKWEETKSITSAWNNIKRMRDTALPPFGMDEALAKLRRKAQRFWRRP